MSFLLPYTSALLLGSMHALALDHVAAVTAFAARRPAPLAAARFGLHWAIGHGGVILLAGLLFILIGAAIPEPAAAVLESGVGVVLIGLGLWTARHARYLHAHPDHHGSTDRTHLHSHGFDTRHDHRHGATMVGALHGLAGATPAIVLLQVARHNSVIEGMAYLATFAVGTAISMALYALLSGYLMGRAAMVSQKWARMLGQLTGISTIVIGIFWLLR